MRIHPWRCLGPIFICYTILVCVSVLSSLFFVVIWPWKISAFFLSAISFSVPKGTTGASGAVFFGALIKYVDT